MDSTFVSILKAGGHERLFDRFKEFGIFNDVHLDQFLSLDPSDRRAILALIIESSFRRLDLEDIFDLYETTLKHEGLSQLPEKDVLRRLRNPDLNIGCLAAEMEIDHNICENLEVCSSYCA